MLKPNEIEEIKQKKSQGVLNSALMEEYKIGYAELRIILDVEQEPKKENANG